MGAGTQQGVLGREVATRREGWRARQISDYRIAIYPAMIRGDTRVGQVDDWFWVTASRLTPSR